MSLFSSTNSINQIMIVKTKMYKSIPLTIALLLSISLLKAQENVIKVTTNINTDNSVSFTADKTVPGTYTIILKFKAISNCNDFPNENYTVNDTRYNFLNLKPSNKGLGIGFSYTSAYIRGELNPRYNPNFVYLLPYQKGVKVKVTEAGFLNATYFGSETPPDWKVYRFFTDKADTVTVARKGIVVSILDTYEENSQDLAFTTKVNQIEIEHEDGTLARYRGFKKGIFVKVGQKVLPAEPLGISSKISSNGLYNVSLMLTYLKSVDYESVRNKSLKGSKSLYGFITPYFCTVENTNLILQNKTQYTAIAPIEIVKKELSKKEIKNMKL
jgi:hypothetical protein